MEGRIRQRPDDLWLYRQLALVYARLDRPADAVRIAEQAVELHPVERDAGLGPDVVRNLAATYAAVGESEAAIDRLEYLLTIPNSFVSVPWLRLDPIWDPLRANPRFQALVAEGR